MAKLLLAGLLSLLSKHAWCSPFTVDSSTLYVLGGQVGVATSSPAATLDVNGSAQFGLGTTKSTFTATGLLELTASGIQWQDGSTSTTAVSGGGSLPAVSTRQILTSSGTYTTPAGARQIKIRMVGGGGGGAGATAGTGGKGGATSFYTVVASSGLGGSYYPNDVGGAGGTGGTNGNVTGVFRSPGQPGQGSFSHMTGNGGNSILGGGALGAYGNGQNNTGNSAAANTGGGGGGGVNSSLQAGGAGGAGEYVEFILNNPAATYLYTIGAGGAAGSDSPSGGTGGSGVIIVDEFY